MKRCLLMKEFIDKDSIEIVLISDEKYIIPTSVTMESIIINSSSCYNYKIHLIARNFQNNHKEYLYSLVEKYKNFDLNIIDIDDDFIKDLYVEDTEYDDKYIVATNSALAKFRIASLLSNTSKVLYLDGDLIVKDNLYNLYNTSLNGFYVAAVRDIPQVFFNNDIANDINYFNSGVMLLNLELIRRDNIEQELINTKKGLKNDNLMDQNIFNTVMKNCVFQLPIKYNVCYTNLVRSKNKYNYEEINSLYGSNYKCLKDIYNDASIIHFSSKMKPWLIWDTYLADEWLFYYFQIKNDYLAKNNELIRITRGDRITIEKDSICDEQIEMKEYINSIKEFDIIPIVFATNGKYAPYAATAIESVIHNMNGLYYYDIYVLHDGELLNYQKELLNSIIGENYRVKCIDVRKGIDDNLLYSRAHYSKQMYYRLLIPEIFPYYKKILYLDCDLIVLKDLSELYKENIDGYIMGAVNNFLSVDHKKYVQSLEIDYMNYINTGVLIINVPEFINANIKHRCISYLSEMRQLSCPDQDAINKVCDGKIKIIDDRWNVQWQHIWGEKKRQGEELIDEYINRWHACKNDKYIVHYTSGRKPWKDLKSDWAHFFWKFARQTSFYEEIIFNAIDISTKRKIDEANKKLEANLTIEKDNFSGEYLLNEQKKIKEERDLYKFSLIETRASLSYRIGRVITFVPRLLRHIIFKKPL